MSWQNLTFNGWLQVDTEDFSWGWGASAQQRRRPVRVRGFIQPRSGSTARLRSGQTALALKGAGVNDGSVPNTEGGHIFGLDLGGVDADSNLVPMYGGVNRGAFREIERRLREFALFPGRGACAAHIEIGYANAFAVGADPRVPEVFEVKCFQQVDDLGTITRTTAAAWTELIANQEYPPTRWDLSQFADITRRATLLEIRQLVASNNWLVESLGDPFDDWSKRGLLPAPGQRPYAYLDFLVYSPQWSQSAQMLLPRWDAVSIGPGFFFSEAQRVNVETANRYTQTDERKGECWSDATDDPIQSALTSMGTETGVEIDHIIPKASMGPNIYSNAAVTSAKHNRSKGRS